jgi:hypothetical protein
MYRHFLATLVSDSLAVAVGLLLSLPFLILIGTPIAALI